MLGHLFVATVFAAVLSSSQQDLLPPSPKIDLESVDKTMVIFERAIEHHDMSAIAAISTSQFQHSKLHALLADAPDSARINSAYVSQIAKQRFRVGVNDDLTITFEFHVDRWVVTDADLREHGSRKNKLKPRGFSQLAAEFDFSDVQRAIDSHKIGAYAGVAPYGRLSLGYLRGKKLKPLLDAERTVLNLVLHDGERVREVFYLRLRNVERVEHGRRGWVIDDGGTMLDYLHALPLANLAIDVFNGKTPNVDLKKPSSFVYVDMPPPAALRTAPTPTFPEATTAVATLTVDTIEWHGGEAALQLFVYLSAMFPKPSAIRASIEQGRVVIEVADATFASCKTTNYFACTSMGNRLTISLTPNAPFSEFIKASVTAGAVMMTESGPRISLDVTAKKRINQ